MAKKIYERNPDTGEIRSRDVGGPIGSEKIVKKGTRNQSKYNFPTREKITTSAQSAISRSEILDEIWAADKHMMDGKWYVNLSDVCEILGEDYARKNK
tara:strand:- start:12078 stop:12371 length:294 start_codon:yes stop_codon:yes gene_type:complete